MQTTYSQTAVDTALAGKLSLTGGTLTGPLEQAIGTSLASATTVNLGAATGNVVSITGGETINSLGAAAAGVRRTVIILQTGCTLTHNAAAIRLPGGVNHVGTAHDVLEFVSEGAGKWRCLGITKVNGAAVAYQTFNVSSTLSQVATAATGATLTVTLTESVTDGETCTVNMDDGSNTLSFTFEYDDDASMTGGNIPVSGGAAGRATSIAEHINSNIGMLVGSASSDGANLTISCGSDGSASVSFDGFGDSDSDTGADAGWAGSAGHEIVPAVTGKRPVILGGNAEVVVAGSNVQLSINGATIFGKWPFATDSAPAGTHRLVSELVADPALGSDGSAVPPVGASLWGHSTAEVAHEVRVKLFGIYL